MCVGKEIIAVAFRYCSIGGRLLGFADMADAILQPAAAVSIPQDFFNQPSRFLRALSDPVRWTVLRELASGKSFSVLELSALVKRSPDLTSKHLKTLREAGAVIVVVAPDGDGRKSHYTVPEKFRRTDESGKPMIDYGVCALRFP
jgi:DNA-binding transcriptional ArsR family regulator